MSVNLYKNGDLIPIAGNGGGVEVDAELSADSENPVQNKAIDAKIKELESGISNANNAFSKLKDVAKTGSYNDLTDKPSIPEAVIVDSELSDSANPVQNRAITKKINAIDAEMESVKKSVSDGKGKIAAAITEKGIVTAADADFATMADNIGSITGGSAESYESVRVENISFAGLHDFDIPSRLGRASIPYVINPSFKENKIELEMTVAKNYEKLEKEPILSGVVA